FARVLVIGDLMGAPDVNVPWLAFCSGQYLKSESRPIPMLNFYAMGNVYENMSAVTKIFPDDLGLPIGIEVSYTNQPVCQYRTVGSTNLLGWNFPLEFHVAEYRRTYETHSWEVSLTASGKVTRIGVVNELEVPEEAREAVR